MKYLFSSFQCILRYFGLKGGIGKIHAHLKDNKLILSDKQLVKDDNVVIKVSPLTFLVLVVVFCDSSCGHVDVNYGNHLFES